MKGGWIWPGTPDASSDRFPLRANRNFDELPQATSYRRAIAANERAGFSSRGANLSFVIVAQRLSISAQAREQCVHYPTMIVRTRNSLSAGNATRHDPAIRDVSRVTSRSRYARNSEVITDDNRIVSKWPEVTARQTTIHISWRIARARVWTSRAFSLLDKFHNYPPWFVQIYKMI